MIAAVDEAEARVNAAPDTYPLFANLLAEVNMLMVQQARSALARSEVLVREALSCSTAPRADTELNALAANLKKPLIDEPSSHTAAVSGWAAKKLGLPAAVADVTSQQWQLIWKLWTRYYMMGCFPMGRTAVYEGRRASHIYDPASVTR
ncbi:hypothetical protein WEI85_07155 [Actinomycetes bacterium KLBMP 9797]